MLRNRSRTVTSKKALMADRNSFFSPTTTTTNSSFLNSPRFLNGFLSKNLFDPETPTSILDNKNNSPTFVNPFGYDKIVHKTENPSSKLEPQPQQAIGLALIDSIIEEKNDDDDGNLFKPVNRMVLFGSKLKVQIPSVGSSNPPPPPPPLSPSKSPESPGDFGIKTRHSQLMMMSPFSSTTTPVKEFSRQLSLKEMELSEDYTCVISHGPNYKKTTHIFDDCVVESCDDNCDVDDDDESVGDEKNLECGFEVNDLMNSVNVNFLSFCYNCQRSLEQGQDIYMYRGDKAFCSQECRGQEILFELKNPDSD